LNALRRLPFPVALTLLAVATLAGVAGLYYAGFGKYSLAAVVVTAIVALLYLREYSKLPVVVPPLRPRPEPATPTSSEPQSSSPSDPAPTPAAPPEKFEPIDESEPFDDPVEEAARLDAQHPGPSGTDEPGGDGSPPAGP
jgi:hypothetical protein